jgi:uncharacterized repeat protein (TIGR03803 family)
VRDAAGNIYGTTTYGGANIRGNIFKLTPTGTITNLYTFTGANGDGEWPATNLAIDRTGNLYGSTQYGGSSNCSYGCGTVFTVNSAGEKSTIYSFGGAAAGFDPSALILDGKGNLFGVSVGGGKFGFGNAFELKAE